jgi:hypothetical protein
MLDTLFFCHVPVPLRLEAMPANGIPAETVTAWVGNHKSAIIAQQSHPGLR